MKSVAVIGLGYVGLPLALLADKKGFSVIGIDLDQAKLKLLKNKKSPIAEDVLQKQLVSSHILFSNDFSLIKNVDIAIICVPTPVNKQKMPDLTLLKKACSATIAHLKKDALLIIESTINPGVCDEVIKPLIETGSSQNIFLAHCPERINPGDPKWHVGNISRVLGADNKKGLELAYNFYINLIDAPIKKMSSLKEAEAVKIVENSFRDINIAFVNELAKSFATLGINAKNVIDGAATKPFAFMAHYPGIGVGGHCIPVDPYYLIEYAKNMGFEHKFLSLARSINETMPKYAINLLEKTLKEKTTKGLKGSKVVVLGLSYKANVADDRESPSYPVIAQLKDKGANVRVFDPYFPDRSDAESLGKALEDQDAAILISAHREFTEVPPTFYSKLSIFLDGRNVFAHQREEFESLGVSYLGIGT